VQASAGRSSQDLWVSVRQLGKPQRRFHIPRRSGGRARRGRRRCYPHSLRAATEEDRRVEGGRARGGDGAQLRRAAPRGRALPLGVRRLHPARNGRPLRRRLHLRRVGDVLIADCLKGGGGEGEGSGYHSYEEI